MLKKKITFKEFIKNENENETSFLMRFIPKNESGLPINIWVNENNSLNNIYNFPPNIKFQNDYEDKITLNYIPISISKDPEILISSKINISDNDFSLLKQFIIRNEKILLKHNSQKIDTEKLIKKMDINKKFTLILEEYKNLFEMANIKKELTNIGIDIWIDEIGGARQNKHNEPRIKFKDKNGTFIPMSIPRNKNEKPKIFLLNGEKYTPIYNSHRIGQIKNFIIRNRELLLSHWDGKITTKEFISKMKKV